MTLRFCGQSPDIRHFHIAEVNPYLSNEKASEEKPHDLKLLNCGK